MNGEVQAMLRGKRVLVTGGSGFIGSHLVEGLLAEGCLVAVAARTPNRLSQIPESSALSFFSCELQNSQETVEVIGEFEPEVLFHLAGRPDAREDFDQARNCLQDNVMMTLNVLEAFRIARGQLFIYGDSCKAYDGGQVPYSSASTVRPLSSYGIAKVAGWELCDLYRRVHGIATVSVRPTMVHGPRQAFNLITHVVDCVVRGDSSVVLDGGTQTRDLLYVKDLVDAYLCLAASGPRLNGKVIHVGGAREATVAEIAQMVLDIVGSDVPIVVDPRRTRATEMARSYCDNKEAGDWLGWRPSTGLRRALEQTVQDLLLQRAAAPVPSDIDA